LFALIKISISRDGAQAVVKAQALEFAVNFLGSQMKEERAKACKLLSSIGEQQSNITAICSFNLPKRFVSLTR
jgi:hypothetical protein